MKLLFPVLLSFFIIGMSIYWVGPEQLYDTFLMLNFVQAATIFLMFCISMVLRAWRFELILNGKLSWPHMHYFMVATFHNVAFQFMPMRSGELVYPYLVRHHFGHSLAKGGAALLYIRFAELFVLVFLFMVSLLGFAGETQGYDFDELFMGVLLLLFVAVFIWLKLSLIINSLSQWLKKKTQDFSSGRLKGLNSKISKLLALLAEELQAKKTKTLHSVTGALSLMNWICIFMIFNTVLQSVGIVVTVHEMVIGAAIASLSQFLPVSTLGNFGTLEAGWTAGFMMVGVDMQEALSSALILHFFIVSFSLFLAGSSWLGFQFYQRLNHEKQVR